MQIAITASKVYQNRDAGMGALDAIIAKLTAAGFTVNWTASE